MLPSRFARAAIMSAMVLALFAQAAVAEDCPADRAYFVSAEGEGHIEIKAMSYQTVCRDKVRYHRERHADECGDGVASYYRGVYIVERADLITETDLIIVESSVYRDYEVARSFRINDPVLAGKPFVWNTSARVDLGATLFLDGSGPVWGRWTLKCQVH